MKISKEQIEQIIREEYAEVEKSLNEMDTVPDEKMAETARKLGAQMGGQPPTAAKVRDALAEVYPISAEAFYSAYEAAQNELDDVYSYMDEQNKK